MGAFEELMNEAKGKKSASSSAFESLIAEAQDPNRRENYGQPDVKDGQYQVGGPIDKIPVSETLGFVEPAMQVGSGMVAGTVAPIVGGVASGIEPVRAAVTGEYQNPLAGTSVRDRIIELMTYQPRTKTGQSNAQQIGGIMQSVGETEIPFTDTQIGEVPEKMRMGDEALEAGLPAPVAMVAEGIPEYLGAALTATGLPAARRFAKSPSTPTQITPKNEAKVAGILTGREEAAKFKINTSGKVVKNPVAKGAVSRGWDERVVGHVAALARDEKRIYKAMTHKAKEYFATFSPKGRPSDVVGNEVAKRVNYLKKLADKNGPLTTKIAKDQLSNVSVNIDDFVTKVMDDITEMGGTIDKNGQLVFGRGSDLFAMTGDQKAIIALFEKLKISGNPTGLEIHNLKKWVREFASFNKSPTTKTEGISGKIDTLFKGYGAELNKKLRPLNKDYARVNDIYSDSINALDDFQRAVGPSTDILADSAPKSIGQKMRSFLGNNANRIRTEDAVGEIQAIAIKHGGKFPDYDIAAQMKYINEMEKMWGPFTDTSFKAEIGQAGQRVAQSPGIAQAGKETVQLTARQLRKAHLSRDSQIKAIEQLLNQ